MKVSRTSPTSGATVSNQGGCDEDIKARLSKASGAFRRLNKIWQSSKFSVKTNVRLFNSLVKPVLLNGSETWKMNEGDNKLLDTFMFKGMRKILHIYWPNEVSNEEILKKVGSQRISEELKIRRWRWIGHVLRMDQGSHCSTALTWTPDGKRSRGRPKTTWRRTVKVERERLGWSTWGQARNVAKDRDKWKSCIRALCATGHEEDR